MKHSIGRHGVRAVRIKSVKHITSPMRIFPSDISLDVKEFALNARKLSAKLGITPKDIERSINSYRKAK